MYRHKKTDIIKDYKNIPRIIKELIPYIVDHYEFDIIKPKVYFLNYVVKRDN